MPPCMSGIIRLLLMLNCCQCTMSPGPCTELALLDPHTSAVTPDPLSKMAACVFILFSWKTL